MANRSLSFGGFERPELRAGAGEGDVEADPRAARFERLGGPQLARLERRVVEVGEKAEAPTVVRGGEEVKAPPLNLTKVEDLVGRLKPITRLSVPRCVSQSIPPGNRVPKGTPVDLVLVPVSDLDFSLFDRVHEDFKPKSIDKLLPLLADPAVAPILQKGRPEDLTETEKTTLRQKLASPDLNITVDDTVPGKSLDLAFNSLKSAKAFQ